MSTIDQEESAFQFKLDIAFAGYPAQQKDNLSELKNENVPVSREQGTHHIYRIPVFEEIRKMALKIVHLDDCRSVSEVERFKKLNHSNIVRLLFYDQDTQYRYFRFELCVASIDQLFLPENDPYKYHGPMPIEEQFYFQVASGLEYLHTKALLVHRSIKPSNVLISSDKIPQIKLSDFDLKLRPLVTSTVVSADDCWLQDDRCWLAPELYEYYKGEETQSRTNFLKLSGDIFAAGSVFFFFSSGGFHLFGENVNEILTNIKNGHQINLLLKLKIGHFAAGLVRWMTQKDWRLRPNFICKVLKYMKSLYFTLNDKTKSVGDIKFSCENVVGSKHNKNTVYLGLFKGSTIAVKEIFIAKYVEKENMIEVNKEIDSLMRLDHPNFIKLFRCIISPDKIIYLAAEKCLTSLDSYCENPILYREIIPMPTDVQVLLQMSEGLEYIHGQNLIYRDVNPRNVLISNDRPAVIKWADFGLSTSVFSHSTYLGMEDYSAEFQNWKSPEVIKVLSREMLSGSIECDIFGLGCVFFFYLVPGNNPFGNIKYAQTTTNIMNNDAVNLKELQNEHFLYKTIKKMIANKKECRPKLCIVIDVLRNYQKMETFFSRPILPQIVSKQHRGW